MMIRYGAYARRTCRRRGVVLAVLAGDVGLERRVVRSRRRRSPARRAAAPRSSSTSSRAVPPAARRAAAAPCSRPRTARRSRRSARPRCSSSRRTGRPRTTTPPTMAAGHVARTPRHAVDHERPGSAARSARAAASAGPTIAPRSSFGISDTDSSVMIGVAIAPKATGAVLATSARAAALIGLKPRAISITLVIATGVPKPASASSSAPKREGDDDRLDPLVVADLGERAAQYGEVAGANGHVVDPDRVDDDPHDREEAERGALRGREERLVRPASGRRRSRRTARRRARSARPSARVILKPAEQHEQRQSAAARRRSTTAQVSRLPGR